MNERPRLPPNQQLIRESHWPVVGESSPAASGEAVWMVRVCGLVTQPQAYTIEQLQTQFEIVDRCWDIHCVTRWSKYDMQFRGVRLAELLAVAAPSPTARYVSFVARSERGHSTSLPLDVVDEVLVCFEANGQPLAEEHGGPVRIVMPGRYFYKSLKWLAEIELLVDDCLGYWEADAGYHNEADPWLEQRYMASDISKQEAALLIQSRDLGGRDLRGFYAVDRELSGLNAADSLLRDADFSRADLQRASFTSANLSNARFVGANLQQADFTGADLDGADFRAADLRGADLRAASMFGSTWCDVSAGGSFERAVIVDESTCWNPALFAALTDEQRDFCTRLASRGMS